MATDVKRRIQGESSTPTIQTVDNYMTRRNRKMAMAKRGLRSLTLAVVVPLMLTIANIHFFGSSHSYGSLKKPFWYPSIRLLHLTCLISTILMGLSAWLVWAEGGFHQQNSALPLFIAQLALGLSWNPLVFVLEAFQTGLVVCVALFGALLGCYRTFRSINPIAGDLINPSFLGVVIMMMINYKLLYN
uniref:Translocator protein homolog n=1 Tax=Nelumbo nucifera TaxID=4432 RepID=A0A822Z3Z9_NELNU|nr:TPA_asm: hypothetical protein HUJ06_013693 [Nelumbo nucifera]